MDEAASVGLLDPTIPSAALDTVRSRKRIRPLQSRLNPPELWPLTEDKVVFGAACRAAGLAAPALYAVVVRGGGGWTVDGETPRSDEAWSAALARVLPVDFVSKPARGHLGVGVRTFARRGDSVTERGGERAMPLAGLRADVLSERQFATHLFQERIRNHPEIARLAGTTTLQTIRAITLATHGEDPELLLAYSKIITGDATVDNFADGSRGNGTSKIDLASGTLGPALMPREDGLGLVELERHPRTGVAFAGFQLPLWSEIVALAIRAAGLFSPARSLAWDIGVTPRGPVLIEANALWGPMNEYEQFGSLLRRLEHAAGLRPPPPS
jgi:hypothetical protein